LTRSGKSVLVTGAQGFIGSWLAERLLEDGARVLVPSREVRRDSRFHRDGIDELCEAVQLDLLDPGSLVRVLNEHDVDLVFHLAAQTIVGAVDRSPFEALEINVRGTYNLLEACRVAGASGIGARVVVASSYHAYGNATEVPYRESVPLRPSHPYEVSKACADILSRSYAATYEIPVAVTRIANVYGGGDLNFSRLVPDAARALVAGRPPAMRSDGTQERDYVYVEDVVSAYLAIADSLEDPRFFGRAWNAGSGTPVAVGDLVHALISAAGSEVEPQFGEPSTGSPQADRRYLDSGAISDELGWQPVWTLADGLARTWEWYVRNL
jgi:CDP-glucose 4,6-dehydratase